VALKTFHERVEDALEFIILGFEEKVRVGVLTALT
jgi:hypothetical protein